jgi:delta 1-pyrroline-5-carboxylate dehydrogenase
MAHEIAQALKSLWEDSEGWIALSRKARQAIVESYSSDHYQHLISQYYQEAGKLI